MGKAGRKPRAIPAKKLTMYISVDLVAEIELLLTDPSRLRWKVAYGAWSSLVEGLLREWVENQKRAAVEEPLPDLTIGEAFAGLPSDILSDVHSQGDTNEKP